MNRRSIVRGIQLIVGITLLTFAYLTFDSFRENPEGLQLGFSRMRPGWLLLGAVLALQEGVCGGLRIWTLGRVLYPELRLRTAVISEFVLMFTAGVTPGQAGAVPSQIAVLMSGGMKFADVATAELLVASCSISFFLISALVITVLRSQGLFVIYGSVPIDWLLGVGVSAFGGFLLLVILAAAYPPLAKGVVRGLTALGGWLWRGVLRALVRWGRTRAWAERSLGKQGEIRARAMLTVDDFHRGFRVYMRRGKRAYLTAFLLTFGFFCSRFAVAYFVLLGLGLPTTPQAFVTVGPPIVQIILVQALLNFVIYLSPIPSAGGLAETASRALMSQWVRSPFEVPYVLAWRLLTQFLCMFVGGIYVFRFLGADVLASKVKEVEAEKQAHEEAARASQRGPGAPPPAAPDAA